MEIRERTINTWNERRLVVEDHARRNEGRWMELAEQAANEQNPAKLLKLIEGINRMLQAKKNRLQGTKKLS